ncbi:MAG: tRNA preQ1(34) S-adenosylmethionine ribosyltransferase-isomerase QueA [Bacteroidales bacterium]|jgi:S-adenosylmethionine:tRNA ribosyltransferase-isomerase|nr:tRNA preQ1(34) S-adenosylmethionine ribosyltransferase-isomerase QueA [Bacteroidales bacterium]
MKLSQFNFPFSTDMIALHPSKNRDEAKLMVVDRKKQKIEHKTFKDILKYFDTGDAFLMNDTKVFPALLSGTKEKTKATITVFLLRELNPEFRLWDVFVEPARKIRIGNKLYFGEDEELVAEVIDNTTSRGRTLRFLFDGPYEEFKGMIQKLGKTPLPEYLTNLRDPEPADEERYQTIYAKNEGAVIAPAAGLHFSRELLKRAEIKGIELAYITEHCGLGNFRRIDVEDLSKHKADSEEVIITQEACNIVNNARANGGKICVVGTSTLRGTEAVVGINGQLKPYKGWTNKFIYPPYDFGLADALVTNFHEPQSLMFMMTCAFGGFELIQQAYKEAIAKKYKFLAYGDAMLIL